jgi:hypothetical protein
MGHYRWYPLLVLFIVLVIAAVFNVIYTNRVHKQSEQQERDNDRKWCALLVPMDEAYEGTPPTTPTGKKIADAISQRRTELGC